MSAPPLHVLVTGYGHFGSALLQTLTSAPLRSRFLPFLLARPWSLRDERKRDSIDALRLRGVRVLEGDLQQSSEEELTRLLRSNSIHSVGAVVGAT